MAATQCPATGTLGQCIYNEGHTYKPNGYDHRAGYAGWFNDEDKEISA